MALNIYFTLLVILYGGNNWVNGYPTGAPQTACVTMTPVHSGSAPQTDAPPFEITVIEQSYEPNQNVTVILSAPCSTDQFAGFLLQARRADVGLDRNQPLGTFNTVAGSKHVALCGNGRQAVTHVDTTPKTQLIFLWTAPPQAVGHIVFAVTFASSKSTFWVKVYSSVIREIGNSVGPDFGTEAYPTLSRCSLPPPTQPPLPTLSPEPSCDTFKSCISDCVDQKCSYIVAWSNSSFNPNGVDFELSSIVDRSTNRWMAIGFSDDLKMGEDKVVECVSFNNAFNVYPSFNTITPRLDNRRNENPLPSDGILNVSASLVDNVFRCSFLLVSDQYTYINLSTPWHLMFARGNTATFRDNKLRHSINQGQLPPVTPGKILFLGDPYGPHSNTSIVPNTGNTKSTGLTTSAGFVMITWSLIVLVSNR